MWDITSDYFERIFLSFAPGDLSAFALLVSVRLAFQILGQEPKPPAQLDVDDDGVARALREAGGAALGAAAAAHAPLSMGDVAWTAGGELPARWVVHAVAARDGAICIQRCTMRFLLEAQLRAAVTTSGIKG